MPLSVSVLIAVLSWNLLEVAEGPQGSPSVHPQGDGRSGAPRGPSAPDTALDETTRERVRDHVKRTRQWSRDAYTLELKGRKDAILFIWVVHDDDLRTPIPGGGKSFAVEYDVVKQEVVREWGFQ